jgi:hypothetical protein
MKRTLSAIALFLAVGAWTLAQEPAKPSQHTETTVKQKGPGPDTKTKMESVTGIVKEYEPGKKIKVEGPGGKDYSFDLEESARVSGTIAVGQTARVDYYKGADGRERVSVLSDASKAAASAAGMPRSVSEQTMKQKVVGGEDTKIKTETVIGVVKEYEPGKKLVVAGPKDKDYKFDLDEAASISEPLTVGERVKVTYQKGDAGEKVTVVARYTGKV